MSSTQERVLAGFGNINGSHLIGSHLIEGQSKNIRNSAFPFTFRIIRPVPPHNVNMNQLRRIERNGVEFINTEEREIFVKAGEVPDGRRGY